MIQYLPIVISAIKAVLKKKAPDVVDKFEEVLADPKTKVELEKLALEKMKLEMQTEKWELEDRQSARELASKDVMSDSWLSKNIRPLVLISLTLSFLLLTFTSAFMAIQTPDKLIDTFQSLLMWVFAFYFGGRSVEKVLAVFANKSR